VLLLMTLLVVVFFMVGTRRLQVVPRGFQHIIELAIGFVREEIIDSVIGKEGRRYLPYLATLFFMIFAMNIAAITPLLNISPSALIGIPAALAATSYIAFNYVGIREHGFKRYLGASLFPAGVPKPIYILLTPLEFISTFILRPFTLAVRLMANMMAGHMLLVLFFTGASYLLLDVAGPIKVAGVFSAGMGLGFTLFEILVATLQAYIFTLLTAVYIGLAMSTDH
jgi:F-type H+-transporting ATPase subunit a